MTSGTQGNDDKDAAPDSSRNCTPEALVALNRAVTTARLLSGVVHEVNNALLVISGTVELLEGRADLPETASRPLERLRTQSQRMAAAIAQVAAFTQAPIGERVDVDLRELTRSAVDLRRFAVTRAGLTIEFAANGPSCLVHGNGAELQQAILNLLINAEHALAGTRGRIEVNTERTDEWVGVRVSDSRPHLERNTTDLFEPFVATRAPSDTSGLNLFAARVIAEAHGGSLVVDTPEGGASFILRLPPRSSSRR
jgi:two-component system, NtrC family, sensor kinase